MRFQLLLSLNKIKEITNIVFNEDDNFKLMIQHYVNSFSIVCVNLGIDVTNCNWSVYRDTLAK